MKEREGTREGAKGEGWRGLRWSWSREWGGGAEPELIRRRKGQEVQEGQEGQEGH